MRTWVVLADKTPDDGQWVWICRRGGGQVALARWDVVRKDRFGYDLGPGFGYHEAWGGTDGPTHWMPADKPAAIT